MMMSIFEKLRSAFRPEHRSGTARFDEVSLDRFNHRRHKSGAKGDGYYRSGSPARKGRGAGNGNR